MEKLENIKLFLLEHKYWFIGGGVIFLLLLGIIFYFFYSEFFTGERKAFLLQENVDQIVTDKVTETEEITNDLCQVAVDIKGEVVVPGVYQLDCDLRVKDAIDIAGGVTKNSDTSVLNLSRKLEDEMVIIVYSKKQVANFVSVKEEEEEKQAGCQNQSEIKNDACIYSENLVDNTANEIIGDTPVNSMISLNHATKEELMTLSGIGESKADNIILYREENGGFQTIEELKNVKGIGDSIFEKIKANITI